MEKTVVLRLLNFCSWVGCMISVFSYSFINRAMNEQLTVTIMIIYGMSNNISDIIGCWIVQKDELKNLVYKLFVHLLCFIYTIDIIGLMVYVFTSNIKILMISDVIVTIFDVLIYCIINESRNMLGKGKELSKQQRYRDIFRSLGCIMGSVFGILFSLLIIKNNLVSKNVVIFCETIMTLVTGCVDIFYYKVVCLTIPEIKPNHMKLSMD